MPDNPRELADGEAYGGEIDPWEQLGAVVADDGAVRLRTVRAGKTVSMVVVFVVDRRQRRAARRQFRSTTTG